MGKLDKAKQAVFYFHKNTAGSFAAKGFRSDKPIWLISERGIDAQDNGFAFFQYMIRHHSDMYDVWYIIDRSSPDYAKVRAVSDHIIQPGSKEHYMMLYKAQALISTHAYGYTPDMALYYRLAQAGLFHPDGVSVFLQHGLLDKRTTWLDRAAYKPDLFEVSAYPELVYVHEGLHHPNKNIMPTGMCRYDTLYTDGRSENVILIFPTWRIYLRDLTPEAFKQSRYYRFYQALINEDAWQALPEGWQVIFCLHPEMQNFADCFSAESPVHIEAKPDIGSLIRRNALLITDFSSVYFDEVYQRKPVVFTQFDADDYSTKHYQGIYINASRYGTLCTDPKEAAEAAVDIVRNGAPDISREKLFLYRDNENCSRTFTAVCGCIAAKKREALRRRNFGL